MKRELLTLAAVLTIAGFADSTPAGAGEPETSAVVTLIVKTRDGSAFGSGAFVSPDGIVLTCYHVVEGATSIALINGRALVTDNFIVVESIDPEHDIATLRVADPQLQFAHLPIANTIPTPLDHLWILGYVSGLANQSVLVRTTQSGFARSGKFTDGALPLFANPDVNLIPLNSLIYRGMSGAPLVLRNQAIGVVSGSLNEGGSLAWAVPVQYLGGQSNRLLRRRAADVNWPALRLMGGSWSNLRRQLTVDPAVGTAIGNLIDASDKLGNLFERRVSPGIGRYLQMIQTVRSLMATIPRSEDSLRLPDSRGFSFVRSRYEVAVRAAEDGLDGDEGCEDLLHDPDCFELNDVYDEWKDAAKLLERRLLELGGGAAAAARKQVHDVLLRLEVAENQDPSPCDAWLDESIPRVTIAQVRVAISDVCVAETREYFAQFKKDVAITRTIGTAIQALLQDSMLVSPIEPTR